MKKYSVVRIGTGELAQVHDMAEIVFRDTYRAILSDEQVDYMMEWMYSLPNLHQQLSEGHVYFVVYEGNKPCGYVSVQRETMMDEMCWVYHLQKLYVMPSEQGKGVGKLLFDTVIEFVRFDTPRFPVKIELNVNRNNPAIDFYKKMGMSVLRQGDFDIGHDFYMNDYIMGMTLKC